MAVILNELEPVVTWLLRLSAQAAVLILLILLIQTGCGSRLAARWRHALWLLVVVRLMLPVSLPSRFSIFNLVRLKPWPEVITGTAPASAEPRAAREARAKPVTQPLAWIGVYDWVPDGSYVLAEFQQTSSTADTGKYRLVLVSIDTGSVRVLKEFSTRGIHGGIDLSPDGRYVVYDRLSPGEANNRDIFLLVVEGGEEISLMQHRADDHVLGWSPDGRWLLFASDRRGTMDAWKLRVEKGKAQGDPELLKANLGQQSPLGMTQNGNLYFGESQRENDLYAVKVDTATGQIKEKPQRLTDRHLGHNNSPTWSPDGKILAYLSVRNLCLLSMESGEHRELPLSLQKPRFPNWTADGKYMRVFGSDSEGHRDVFQVNLQTGALTPLNAGDFRIASATGDTLAFRWQREKRQIEVKDVRTGQVKVLYQVPEEETHGNPEGNISPNGKQIALVSRSEKNHTTFLRAVSTDDGKSRDLLQTTNTISALTRRSQLEGVFLRKQLICR